MVLPPESIVAMIANVATALEELVSTAHHLEVCARQLRNAVDAATERADAPLPLTRPTEHGEVKSLLTTKQVAALLHQSPRQVLRLAIPRVRLGPKTIRFRREDVNAHIKARTTTH